MRRGMVAVLVVTAFLGAGCVTLSQETDGRYRVLGDPKDTGLEAWPGMFQAALVAYDFDGDGVQEIVGHSSDAHVYVFSGSTGKVLARFKTTYPPAWFIQQVTNAPAVGALAPGAPPSIVIVNHASYVSSWQFVPERSDEEAFVFERRWETRTTDCHRSPGADAKPVLADLTGDGRLEILVQTEEVGLYAYTYEGKQLWHHCWGGGNGAPAVGDLDGDGRPEVVFASDGGLVSVFRGASGAPLWTFDVKEHGVRPGSIPVSPTLADLDGDGTKEVLFIARHALKEEPEAYPTYHMAIFAVAQDPTTWKPRLLWKEQPEWANPMSYTHLVVLDIDGDGAQDVFGMDWNTIGHRPGEWEVLGPGHAFRLTAEGETVWVREIDSWWSNKDIAIGDLDGDGATDIVVNGQRDGVDGVWRLDPETGTANGFFGVPGWKLHGGPVFLDVRGDGKMQLAYRVAPAEGDDTKGGILLYELDVPYAAQWRGVG